MENLTYSAAFGFRTGDVIKTAMHKNGYVAQIEKHPWGAETLTVKPLSKWWLFQIWQVFVMRIKYRK